MSGSRQIEQMCKFILQEANEKANEIRIKTEHDFHKDKQLRVIAANKKTDEAFEKRKIQLESDKKVSRSKAVADARKEKGETAHTMVGAIQNHALGVLGERVKANPSGYRELMGQLISEGLVQLDEAVITLEVLESEVELVGSLCGASLEKYKEVVKAQYDADPVKYSTQFATSQKCVVKVSEKRRLDLSYIGGVRLVGDNGRIVCDNTLKTRLNIVVEEQLPQIRLNLFPSLTAPVLNGTGESKGE